MAAAGGGITAGAAHLGGAEGAATLVEHLAVAAADGGYMVVRLAADRGQLPPPILRVLPDGRWGDEPAAHGIPRQGLH